MSASIEQIWNIVASHPKFFFSPTFIFGSPICSYNCGVVFLWKYISVFEKWPFSFDRSNMQIFTVNTTRVVSCNDCTRPTVYLCTESFVLSSKLNLSSLLKLAKRYLFFWWVFLSEILFLCRKVASNKDSFNNDQYDKIYWASSFLKTKGWF